MSEKALETFFQGEEQDLEILSNKLREVAEKMKYDFRELSPKEPPKLSESEYQGPELEEAWLHDKERDRALYYGNTHGLIFPCLNEAVKHEIIELPIPEIVNADFHADIAPHTPLYTTHTATWQRYGAEQRFWKQGKSFNWRPDHSTAPPMESYHPERYIVSITTEEAADLRPEALSVDLDFFNFLEPDSKEYEAYLKILKKMIQAAKLVMVFSSSGWTKDKLSLKNASDIVGKIQQAFLAKEE